MKSIKIALLILTIFCLVLIATMIISGYLYVILNLSTASTAIAAVGILSSIVCIALIAWLVISSMDTAGK